MKTARFDQAGEQFVGYYDTVRGHVRQEVTRHNLMEWLPEGRTLEVLDFGGGDGRDAIWLAAQGHQVTLLDESQAMIAKAAANAQSADISDANLRILPGSLDALDDEAKQFDVILSHGVLMYELADPAGQLGQLSARLRSDGLLSLLTKGRAAARNQISNHIERTNFETSGQFTNRLGQQARAYDFTELEGLLAQARLKPIARYGVRVLSDDDRRPLSEVPEKDLAALIAEEKAAGRDPDQNEQAQMLHLIAVL